MNAAIAPNQVDVRFIPPIQRHHVIFQTFRGLGANESMELVNDHDPKPLFHEFQSEAPGQYSWDDLELGPDVFRVRITRLTRPQRSGSCCGGCGGDG